jgi:hypothetical protein
MGSSAAHIAAAESAMAKQISEKGEPWYPDVPDGPKLRIHGELKLYAFFFWVFSGIFTQKVIERTKDFSRRYNT